MANIHQFVCVLQSFLIFVGSVYGVDVTIDEVEERECHGTNNGMGFSGTTEMHYERLKQRYTDCTYVNGNLEITNLWDSKITYDLSFLRGIRYISGYALFAITQVDEIPLDSLEVIRGNQTKELMGEHYSLIVALTSSNLRKGLREIHIPRLKEITQGKVLFTQNPRLEFVNTIDWEPIMRGRYDFVNFLERPFNENASSVDDNSICPDGMRWGDKPYLCQEIDGYFPCHESCNGRCYGEESDQCCHDTCAVGCTGPDNTDCLLCKDYIYEGACEGFCPHMTYAWKQHCVKYNDDD